MANWNTVRQSIVVIKLIIRNTNVLHIRECTVIKWALGLMPLSVQSPSRPSYAVHGVGVYISTLYLFAMTIATSISLMYLFYLPLREDNGLLFFTKLVIWVGTKTTVRGACRDLGGGTSRNNIKKRCVMVGVAAAYGII